MKIKNILLLAFVLIMVGSIQIPAFSKDMMDPCRARIPKTLANLLAKQFPEYRLPVIDDHGQKDIAYNRNHGGDGCLSGDGRF